MPVPRFSSFRCARRPRRPPRRGPARPSPASRRARPRRRAPRARSGRRSPRRRRPPSTARAPRTSGAARRRGRCARRSAGELRPRGEPRQGGDRRRPERVRRPSRLAVGREQVADVGSRVADRAHLPVENGDDLRRVVRSDHRVPEPEVAVHHGRRKRLGQVAREPPADLVHGRHLARLVDPPELGEAPNLALAVAPGPRERRERRARHVGGMDLDERVDEVVPEAATRCRALEPGGQLLRRHVPLEVVHDVEGDSEDALVLAHRDDRRQAREPGLAEGELEPCLADDVVR